ncbi:MAG: ribose 5-phosphate isomerase B [Alloprevotella sp.]|nr:ribose 5-phosphate isomerase B [Alloprevotella sp.]MBR6338738.1 ribose 5-phosphate isomerase B [Alloprevotella sp.]
MLPIGLASDHAGFPLKEHVKTLLDELQLPYVDYGTHSTESCDYPDFAHALARAIERGDVERGIAVCGSGQGITITLNKHRAVRAALSWLPEIAALARQHNDANVLTMPGRFISNDEADAIVRTFLSTPFEGGRHQRRVEKITEGL